MVKRLRKSVQYIRRYSTTYASFLAVSYLTFTNELAPMWPLMMTSCDHSHFRFLRYGVPKYFVWVAISREPFELSPRSFRRIVRLDGADSSSGCTLAYIASASPYGVRGRRMATPITLSVNSGVIGLTFTTFSSDIQASFVLLVRTLR